MLEAFIARLPTNTLLCTNPPSPHDHDRLKKITNYYCHAAKQRKVK